ncbi:ATP-binding protein [Ruania zhangjianzhongii]|uniref:ATP-binding protein n=1 Tax=Ruania zhangjianzhongii TaxID=2603206 RepID=UPI0011CCD751|nr:ATP-binding protein [Ruania zhangjianzhongii]
MTAPDLLRPSRDGDQFHYTWAARQSLRLLDERSGLHTLIVEGVDPSEQAANPEPSSSPDASTTDGDWRPQAQPAAWTAHQSTGDEVIDLSEYWGSSDIDQANRVVYRQFKHSTRHADTPWTLSFLSKTLIGFARKYRALKANHPAALERTRFEFISNRAPAPSALRGLRDLSAGTLSTGTRPIRSALEKILDAAEITDLCKRTVVDERAPSLLKLRNLLDLEVADLLPGAPAEQALLLREMISSRATSIAGSDPTVRREDVLAALRTSEDQLLPAPNLIDPPRRPITRHHFTEIALMVKQAPGVPTLVHGPGGVGKSVLAEALADHLPHGSVTIVFDCFGNGSYRRPSAPRHRPKQGFVQLVNELAGRRLCDPIIPSATADEADYARAFLGRLSKASANLSVTDPDALLTIVVDAADNAAMIAEEMGERSFAQGLVRERLPPNVRLLVTSRSGRISLLGLPSGYQDVALRGFDLDETRDHLRTVYASVSDADASEFHARTSRNPRVQATVLDATDSLHEALTWLAPNPVSAGDALDSLIERQVADLRDRQHGAGAEIDAICVGLAALRPMIPVRVLAELAGVHVSVVLSFVSDLGRPLLVDGGSVQFRDEPTETWFRDRYRPKGLELEALITRLAPIADQDAYVAASLPALLFEANRFSDLVRLALSDDRLPGTALPAAKRNEIQRREIAQQRTHFALTAALRADRDFEAAQLALRLGALTAGRTRRLDLIRDHTDLAARFLDPSVLEQLVATRSITAGWPNSNLPIEGALLSGADGQTAQARNRLRSAVSWMHAWVRQSRRDDAASGVGELDILQVAWGLLNTDGPTACVSFLRSWRPRTLAFDVGVVIVRRLLDAGRLADLDDLARLAKGRYLKLAVAHVCAERNVELGTDIIERLLRPVIRRKRPIRPTRHDDFRPTVGDPVHGGLTAVNWLISRAIAEAIITPSRATQLLRRYLPENLGHRTGGRYDRDVWQLILGFTLLARLEGRTLDPLEIQGARIRDARERENFESSRELREYRENIEPLVSWAAAWLDLDLGTSAERTATFGARASGFLQAAPLEWGRERIDHTRVNVVLRIIGRAIARHPEIVDHSALIAYERTHGEVINRRTLTYLTQQAATQPSLHALSSQIAADCHRHLSNAREDAGDLAADFVQLARATQRTSSDEAAVHFRAALEITNAIGDDAWTRWSALLAIANSAGANSGYQPGRAYRLGQIAESIEHYLGDDVYHADILTAAARLSLPEALAIGSRWRDRRISPIGDLADAIVTTPSILLNADPLATLILLPLGRRYPDQSALGTSLASTSSEPFPAVLAYLRFRRAHPPTANGLEELLTASGITRETLERVDPSLLWTSEPRRAGDHSSRWSDRPDRATFDDLDLTTIEGWAKGLERGRQVHAPEDIFAYVVRSRGATPDILRAFAACPTVSFWDLRRLLESLLSQPLSMASQAVLDEVLVAGLRRFAPNFLLVTWRTLDLDHAHATTGTDTDYEHVASRALADRQAFTAEEAYALATNLARRLESDDALEIFDAAAALFDEIAPEDALDGLRPHGSTVGWDPNAATASVIWTALGDPAGQARWRAAHCVHLALVLGHTGIASHLLELALGRTDPGPFLDARLEFYERHARQWLLFGISRAAAEPSGLPTAALFLEFLVQTLNGSPHAVNTQTARDILLRLQAGGFLTLDPREKARIEGACRPIGTVRRDWGSELDELSSLAQLTTPQDAGIAHASGKDEPLLGACTGAGPASGEANTSEERERFHFFFDFRQYWCKPLGEAFALTEGSVERLVSEVLIDRWAVASRGRAEDDPRHKLDLYPSSGYSHKSEWPGEEDLDFYLAVQALYEVAGMLLAHRPVVFRSDDDADAGDSEYGRFLERHIPSRADGRWLSDRQDSEPARAIIEEHDRSGPETSGQDPYWIYQINSARFNEELRPSPDQVVVWESRYSQYYSRSERVSVHSALVNPSTATALIRALQTAPDKHAFRIPDADDEEYSSAVPGFELTGWINSPVYTSGRDCQDPYAGSMEFPPIQFAEPIPRLGSVTADTDYRIWSTGTRVVATSTQWSNYTDARQTVGSAGHSLTVDLSWLTATLRTLDRWLIVEVEVQRRSEDSSPLRGWRDDGDDEDDRMRFLQPYTKYFLFDTAGDAHEF